MATVCAPELVWPDHLIPQDAMVQAVADRRRGLPHLDRGLQVMRNTQVTTRHMLRSLDDTLDDQQSFDARNQLYATHAVQLGIQAGARALATARVDPIDVDALVVVSCTGYMLPGPDATSPPSWVCGPPSGACPSSSWAAPPAPPRWRTPTTSSAPTPTGSRTAAPPTCW